jgi:hypothetical protein
MTDRAVPIAEVLPDFEVAVQGVVYSTRSTPWANGVASELMMADRTGRVLLRFTTEPDIFAGQWIAARGVPTTCARGLMLLDPVVRVERTGSEGEDSTHRSRT